MKQVCVCVCGGGDETDGRAGFEKAGRLFVKGQLSRGLSLGRAALCGSCGVCFSGLHRL